MIQLQQLTYDLDALAPIISQQTLEFHHGKHLKGYVDNLNKLIVNTDLENKSLEEIIYTANHTHAVSLFNNAGQIFNHNYYFEQFCAKNDFSELSSESRLYRQITSQWESLEKFKAEFVSKGVSLFGSGWVWLSALKDGTLEISQHAGASTPMTQSVQESDVKPLLTFDVWEHAYYLDYQNRRADHLASLWQIVNWKKIEERYIF